MGSRPITCHMNAVFIAKISGRESDPCPGSDRQFEMIDFKLQDSMARAATERLYDK